MAGTLQTSPKTAAAEAIEAVRSNVLNRIDYAKVYEEKTGRYVRTEMTVNIPLNRPITEDMQKNITNHAIRMRLILRIDHRKRGDDSTDAHLLTLEAYPHIQRSDSIDTVKGFFTKAADIVMNNIDTDELSSAFSRF